MSHRPRTRAIFALAAALLGATRAFAGDVDTCAASAVAGAMAACNRAIASGRNNNATLSDLYFNRGALFDDQKDYDNAIADYSQSIALNPKKPDVFEGRCGAYLDKGDIESALADCNQSLSLDPKLGALGTRGNVYSARGEFPAAIADYNQAIQRNPKDGINYQNRGYAYFAIGNFAAAADDMMRANVLTPDPYAILWRFLAVTRTGKDGTAELGTNLARTKTKDWPFAMMEFYLGRRSFEAMIAAANTDDKMCEAQFYIGQWNLMHNNIPDGLAALQVAATSCPVSFSEAQVAAAELHRFNP